MPIHFWKNNSCTIITPNTISQRDELQILQNRIEVLQTELLAVKKTYNEKLKEFLGREAVDFLAHI